MKSDKRSPNVLSAMDQVRKFSKCLLRISRPNLKESELDAFADKLVLITQEQVQKSTSPKAKNGTKSENESVISSLHNLELDNLQVVNNSTGITLNSKAIPTPINNAQVTELEAPRKETKKTALKKFAATTKKIINGGKIPYKVLQEQKIKTVNPHKKKVLEENQLPKTNLHKPAPPQNKPKAKETQLKSSAKKMTLSTDIKKEVKETKDENKADADNFKEFIKKKMGLKSPICPRYFKTLLETYKSKDEFVKKTTNEFTRSKSSRVEKKKGEKKDKVLLPRSNSLPHSIKKQNNSNKTQQNKMTPAVQTGKTPIPVTLRRDSTSLIIPRCSSLQKEKRDVSRIPLPTPTKNDNTGTLKNSRDIGPRTRTYIVEKTHKKEPDCVPPMKTQARIVKPVSRIPKPKVGRPSPVAKLESLDQTDKDSEKISTQNNTMNISDLCSEFSKLDMMSTSSPHLNKNRRESLRQFWPKVTVISEPQEEVQCKRKSKAERLTKNNRVESVPKRLFSGDESLALDKSLSVLGERNFNHTTTTPTEKHHGNNTKGKENVYFIADKILVKCYCKSPKFHGYEEFDEFCVPSPITKRYGEGDLHFDEINDNVVFVEVFRAESNTLSLIHESQKKVLGVMEELLSIQARLNALKLKFSKPVLRHYYFV